jgi:Arc/MetJ-type ribon-helix-helix transcriptional regulator
MDTKDKQLDKLRAALDEGEASGPTEPFDFDNFIADQKARKESVKITETPPR